jgi:phage recombination protein Bet
MNTRNPAAHPLAAASPCRVPISQPALDELGLDVNTWRVLTDSIFPSAKTADGIALAVRYCQARGLDVLKRPVHVVPMWSKAQGREIETVWPGINEVQVTAARTGQYAGIDPPKLGPDVTRTFSGKAKTDGGWSEISVEVIYPEWCEVTVYRLVNGQRWPFTETVFWEETYSRAGGASCEVPTAMWVKRPRGQLIKCAKAAALRAAFPEEGTYVAEEMEGKVIEPEELPA